MFLPTINQIIKRRIVMITKIKLPTKILAVLLTMLFVLEILPTQLIADAYNDLASKKEYISNLIDNPAECKDTEKAEILYEVIEKRDEYTKVFKRADGSYTAFMFEEPIHFEENGKWEEIDNSLVEKNGVLRNTKNSFNVEFPTKLSESKEIKIENDGCEISFAVNDIDETSSKVEKIGTEEKSDMEKYAADTKSFVSYDNVSKNTTIEYAVLPNGIKENIIVNSVEDVKNTYSFDINVGELVYKRNADNSIDFTDAKGNIRFSISKPVMLDSKSAVSYEIDEKIIDNKDGTITLIYSPSMEWIRSTDRVFPIIIDPAIFLDNNDERYENQCWFEDTAVLYDSADSSVAEQNYYSDTTTDLYNTLNNNIGKYGEVYTKINTDYFASFGKGIVFTNVQYLLPCVCSSGNVVAKELTSSCNYETVTYNSGRPSLSDNIIDYYTSPNTSGTLTYNQLYIMHFDITEAFNRWVNGGTNYGFALVPSSGLEARVQLNGISISHFNNHYYTSVTSNGLALDFVYTGGYDDRYGYHSQDVGRAGIAYVNDFTRSLSVIRDDISISGNIMPVNISSIYNSGMSVLLDVNQAANSNLYGKGWTNSFHRQIVSFVEDFELSYFTETGNIIDFNITTDGEDNIIFTENNKDVLGDSGYTVELLELPENYEGNKLDYIMITRPDGYVERFDQDGNLISNRRTYRWLLRWQSKCCVFRCIMRSVMMM